MLKATTSRLQAYSGIQVRQKSKLIYHLNLTDKKTRDGAGTSVLVAYTTLSSTSLKIWITAQLI